MSKVIIGIHGLGNKPEKSILEKWWRDSIEEGLKNADYDLKEFNFELVYWADILHKLPLDENIMNPDDDKFLSEPYCPFKGVPFKREYSYRENALDYLEKYSDKIIVNGIMSLNIPTLTNMFIHKHFRDLEIYYALSFINYAGKKRLAREIIIERLTDVIKKHKNKKIILTAHSMGSIIAYDALMDYLPKDINIETLVTIGSPLAQKYVIAKINEEKNFERDAKLPIPECLKKQWINHYDLEDVVAINNNLNEYFIPNSNGVSVIDIEVKNNYIYKNKGNPHKSYGYLRTKEFASIVNDFFHTNSEFLSWIKDKLKFIN